MGNSCASKVNPREDSELDSYKCNTVSTPISPYRKLSGITPCKGNLQPPLTVSLKNTQDDTNTLTDTLHHSAKMSGCPTTHCQGSLLIPSPASSPKRLSAAERNEELKREAVTFLTLINGGNNSSEEDTELAFRIRDIEQSILTTGTYEPTKEELSSGAKTAWRNAPRCIGRIQWSNLELFDKRDITSTQEMFESICEHLAYATNAGNIRSAITIFPPAIDGKAQCHIWNAQFIQYAGYKLEDDHIVGDPGNVELTKYCMKAGWKGPHTNFDILPLLLQWGDADPEFFEYPPGLVREVSLKHSKYPEFDKLGLKWYAVPAVSNMYFECGGIVYPACGFNGWYMSTEVMRNLCDPSRYNRLQEIAESMQLDTSLPPVYWKDEAAVRLNVAILISYQDNGVTMVDHHTASESFMSHMENETKLRGGCPADWVWITPPLSGALTRVFHQEMLNYKLKPLFDYQLPPWRNYVWKSDRNFKRKFSVKSIGLALKICSGFMNDALAKRVPCTILYATETGNAEKYAQALNKLFLQTFNSQVMCMKDYDFCQLNFESLLLIVTSTFGSGDPPDNGKTFCEKFKKGCMTTSTEVLNGRSPSMSSRKTSSSTHDKRYSVFALGSSAYPHFCAFGKQVDTLISDCGWHRLLPVGLGDALKGQENGFNMWSQKCFIESCDMYNVHVEKGMRRNSVFYHHPGQHRIELSKQLKSSTTNDLSLIHKKPISEMTVISVSRLTGPNARKEAILVKLNHSDLIYSPGDHVAIFPCNSPCAVQTVLDHMTLPDGITAEDNIQLMQKATGEDFWEAIERLTACSLRHAFTHYLDIDCVLQQSFIKLLIQCHCVPLNTHSDQLSVLAKDVAKYELWVTARRPSLLTLLEDFPSIKLLPSLVMTQLPLLQPRLYSVSSSPLLYTEEVHITATVLEYSIPSPDDAIERSVKGLCTNWLKDLQPGALVRGFSRECSSFQLPDDIINPPVLMIGAGSGLAPFRSFWQQKHSEMNSQDRLSTIGPMHLVFGCQTRDSELHSPEIEAMYHEGVLQTLKIAYSRERESPKMYVQDVISENPELYYDLLVHQRAHIYVCGESTMARGVMEMLAMVISEHSYNENDDITDQENVQGQKFIADMKDEGRYHEDIFGALLTAKSQLS